MLVSRIDLWVAATMPADPAFERWLARAAVSTTDLRAMLAEAAEAGLDEPMLEGPQRVVGFFGPPAAARPNQLIYDLALWPAHQFVWAVSRWGDVRALGAAGGRRSPSAAGTGTSAFARSLGPNFFRVSQNVTPAR